MLLLGTILNLNLAYVINMVFLVCGAILIALCTTSRRTSVKQEHLLVSALVFGFLGLKDMGEVKYVSLATIFDSGLSFVIQYWSLIVIYGLILLLIKSYGLGRKFPILTLTLLLPSLLVLILIMSFVEAYKYVLSGVYTFRNKAETF